jgi:hypothetical protein
LHRMQVAIGDFRLPLLTRRRHPLRPRGSRKKGSAWRRPFRSRSGRPGIHAFRSHKFMRGSRRAAFCLQACLDVNPDFPFYGFG